MFHDMSFLKQPRRPPQKAPSSRRESENKRAEREREGISAYFLHKNLPDSYDVQGREQLDYQSGLSSHNDKTGDDSFNALERRRALNKSRLLSDLAHRHARVRENAPREERVQSKSSTCISPSTSRLSTGLRESSESDARKLSSTPARISEALARTGIFDNTGIACRNDHIHQRPEFGPHARDGLVSAISSYMSQTLGKVASPDSGQIVRIVRYQDRGTMADEKMMGLEDHANNTSMPSRPSISQAEPFDTVRPHQSVDTSCHKIPLSEASIGLCKMTNTGTNSRSTSLCDQAIGPDERGSCREAVPERPRSPKCAIVERLEAAAEDAWPPCSPPATSATTHINRHSPRSLVSTTIQDPPNTQVVSTRAFPCVPLPAYDAKLLAPDPFLAMLPRERTSLDPPAPWYSAQFRVPVDETSRPHAITQTQLPTVTHYADQPSSALPSEVHFEPMTAHAASMQHNLSHRGRQSMQNYIVEMERRILDQTDVSEGSGRSPSKRLIFKLNSDLAERHRDAVHASAYLTTQDGLSDQHLDAAPNKASLHHWAAVAELEADEEQRFMSSFWRING